MNKSQLLKTVEKFDNMDAGETAFFARQLEQIRAKTYDVKYIELRARDFIPVDNSVDPGAEQVTYRQYDQVGVAKFISNYADDLPRVDIKGREFTAKVKGIGDAYGYSIQEMRAAKFSGVPMEQRKANAARRAIEYKLDVAGRSGDAETNLVGFLNQTNTTTYTVPNGAAGSPLWVNKTPDEIVADMHGICNGIVSSTSGVEIPDTLLLPIDMYLLVSTKRMGDGSDVTILKYFLGTSPHVKNVDQWYPLATAGATSNRRMVAYRKDPDALQWLIPQEFEQFAPQQKNLEIVTPCHARTGGVVVYYPLSISYGDGI